MCRRQPCLGLARSRRSRREAVCDWVSLGSRDHCKDRGIKLQLWGSKRSGKHTMIEYSCEVLRRRECDRVSRHKNEAFRRGPSKKPSRTFQAFLCNHSMFIWGRSVWFCEIPHTYTQKSECRGLEMRDIINGWLQTSDFFSSNVRGLNSMGSITPSTRC